MVEYRIIAVRDSHGRLVGHEIETTAGAAWHIFRCIDPRPVAGKAGGQFVRQVVVDTEDEPDVVLRGIEP